MADPLPEEILAALRRMDLLTGDDPGGERLQGGVSSDIWRIDLPSGPICVKRALEKLRVEADWHAPVQRNFYEARWMNHANAAVEGSAPHVLGQDEASGTLAMEYLPPDTHPVWKDRLHEGIAEPYFAAKVAYTLNRIHAATAADPDIAAEFPTDQIFYDIRLEPYLIASGRAHPDLASRLDALVEVTQANKRALVHGDVSPKNILCGPEGPVFLDAECAWWGDPAFDLAFCLNHLLLKCLWVPYGRPRYLNSFITCSVAYLGGVFWEPAKDLEARAAHLLPGLMLARIDGKSPVEYIKKDKDKDKVRRIARQFLENPTNWLASIRMAWTEELDKK